MNGNYSWGAESGSEFNKLSRELTQRITQEMNDLMSSMSSQTQRAISEAINEQVLPQIQSTLRSGQGQVPNRGWEVPGRRQECGSEEALNRKFRSSSRDEIPRRKLQRKRRPREHSLQAQRLQSFLLEIIGYFPKFTDLLIHPKWTNGMNSYRLIYTNF